MRPPKRLRDSSRIPPFSSSAGWSASDRTRRGACWPRTTCPRGSTCWRTPGARSRDALVSALASEGVEAVRSPLTPLGLTAVAGNPLRSPLLGSGHFTVQDLGAQVLPLLLPPGELLVDLAAAPGGKSMSALAHGRARVTLALDVSSGRLRRVAENARRLDLAARPVAADLESLPLPAGRFDRVLLDAPCSGTGTLRKNPGDSLSRDAGSDRAPGRPAGALARGGGGAPRARRLAALLDLQPRARGERAGRRACLRARQRALAGAGSSRPRVWRLSSRAPGCGSCRTTASTGSRRTFCDAPSRPAAPR